MARKASSNVAVGEVMHAAHEWWLLRSGNFGEADTTRQMRITRASTPNLTQWHNQQKKHKPKTCAFFVIQYWTIYNVFATSISS